MRYWTKHSQLKFENRSWVFCESQDCSNTEWLQQVCHCRISLVVSLSIVRGNNSNCVVALLIWRMPSRMMYQLNLLGKHWIRVWRIETWPMSHGQKFPEMRVTQRVRWTWPKIFFLYICQLTLIVYLNCHKRILNSIECILCSMKKSLWGSSCLWQVSKCHLTENHIPKGIYQFNWDFYLKLHNSPA